MKIITKNEEETLEFGQGLAKKLKGGEIILLQGDLGMGKTVLARGIAKGLGIKKNITSPTYLLIKTYSIINKGNLKNFIHIDTYRGIDMQEMEELGVLDSIGKKDSIVVVEWGIGLNLYLKNNNIKPITIMIRSKNKTERQIEVI